MSLPANRTTGAIAACLMALASVAACGPPVFTPPPESGLVNSEFNGPEGNGACDHEDVDCDSPPPSSSAAPTASAGEPHGKKPDDARCKVGSECLSGRCEGEGCGQAGRCVSKSRQCTMDLVPYCGCDGKTFRASGTCPGRLYAHRGSCESKKADGAPCMAGGECLSGQCEGEGCEHAGRCVSKSRQCTLDLVPYCGCDGKTFRTSGTCPARRFARRGSCESPPPASSSDGESAAPTTPELDPTGAEGGAPATP